MVNGCAAALTKLRKNANNRAALGISQMESMIFATITMTQTIAQHSLRLPVRSAIVPKTKDDMTIKWAQCLS